MWDNARAELRELRKSVEQTEQLSQAQQALNRARSEREAALLRLGEGFYKLVASGEVTPPAELKRAIGEVKAKEVDLLRQQADIAAILKEADALVEKSRRSASKKKTK
jgi:hypothetical protein